MGKSGFYLLIIKELTSTYFAIFFLFYVNFEFIVEQFLF